MKRSLTWFLPILLSVVAGLLVALAFPPWDQGWLIWVGFTPVLAGLLLFSRRWVAALIQGALLAEHSGVWRSPGFGKEGSWATGAGTLGPWRW